MTEPRTRHILSLSGGKDSAALAIYMRDRVPDMEYVFCDTEKELPETYSYLDRLEAYLGKKIVRLVHDGRGFDHWLAVYGGYLPSAQARWCTRHLKIQPFERYIGDDSVISYVGIRADENRTGYLSAKPNIKAVYPFKTDGVVKGDVLRILNDSGLGLANYYSWRSRSGCFFCFFQQKIEWVGLYESYPDLYKLAQDYEKPSGNGQGRYTWNNDESLAELALPERRAAIRADHAKRMAEVKVRHRSNRPLIEVLSEDEAFISAIESQDLYRACEICST